MTAITLPIFHSCPSLLQDSTTPPRSVSNHSPPQSYSPSSTFPSSDSSFQGPSHVRSMSISSSACSAHVRIFHYSPSHANPPVVRVTAFILRALLSNVTSDAENLNVVIAYQIIYNTGFFGLVYSAYILVTDRYVLSHPQPPLSPHSLSSVALAKNPPNGPISRLLRLRFLFRMALVAAVSIGITGAVQSSLGTTTSTINTGDTLRKIAIYIFLVCAILVLLQTLFLARAEFSGLSLLTLPPFYTNLLAQRTAIADPPTRSVPRTVSTSFWSSLSSSSHARPSLPQPPVTSQNRTTRHFGTLSLLSQSSLPSSCSPPPDWCLTRTRSSLFYFLASHSTKVPYSIA